MDWVRPPRLPDGSRSARTRIGDEQVPQRLRPVLGLTYVSHPTLGYGETTAMLLAIGGIKLLVILLVVGVPVALVAISIAMLSKRRRS